MKETEKSINSETGKNQGRNIEPCTPGIRISVMKNRLQPTEEPIKQRNTLLKAIVLQQGNWP